MRFLVVASAACATVLACSDLSNLSGGTPDAAVTSGEEGGVTPPPPPDASLPDTSAPDAGFCTSRDAAITVFCDDFDAPDRVSFGQTGWQPLRADSPVGELTTARSFSPPRAAFFDFDLDAGAPRHAAGRGVTFPAGKTELVYHVRVFMKSGTTLGGLSIGDDTCEFRWSAVDGTVSSYCNNAVLPSVTSPAAATDTWSAVAFAVKRIPTGANVTVTVGEGANAVSSTHDISFAVPDAGALSSNPGVTMGNAGTDGTGALTFDDVAVEVH